MEILFICWGNINRSQIAEAIFNKLSLRTHAFSAGINPRTPDILLREEHNNPLVPIQKKGYDLSNSVVHRLTEKMIDSAERVIVLLDKSRWRDIPTLVKDREDLEIWDIERIDDDITYEEYCRLEEMRIARIEERVRLLVEEIG